MLAVCGGLAAASCGSDRVAVEQPLRASQLQLLLAGDQQLWIVDPAAGTVRRVALRELAAGDPPSRVARRGDAFVLWGAGTYRWDAGRETLSPLVPDAWFFLPSAAGDRVWVAFLDRDSPPTVRSIRAVREVTIDGVVTVPGRRPPGGRWPVRAMGAGLLVPTADDRGLDLWDPKTDRVLATRRIGNLTNVGPTDGNRLVSCARRCRELQLIDGMSGRTTRIAAPDGMAFETAVSAFSPSGTRLAVPVRSVAAGGSVRRLALVDLARGVLSVVPGSDVPRGYTFVAWSSTGRDVFLAGGVAARRRAITWYRLGDDRARPVRGTFGAFFDMAAS